MSAELLQIPSILDMGTMSRVHAHLTEQNFDTVGTNALRSWVTPSIGTIVTEGLTNRDLDKMSGSLAAQGFEHSTSRPWWALMEITDSIAHATSEFVEPQHPNALPSTITTVTFSDEQGKRRFHHFAESALNGIPNPHQPRIRNTGRDILELHNFAYADNATLGRLATSYMRTEYKHMGSYRRGFAQNSILDIHANGLMERLPPELLDRVVSHALSMGTTSLLSTGRIGVIGAAMREALVPKEELKRAVSEGTANTLLSERLQIQRSFEQKPHIEARTKFISHYSVDELESGIQIPISHTTMTTALQNQVSGRYHEYKKTVQDRDWSKAMQDIWDLATGMGATQGIGAVLRAIATITSATGASLKGKYSDKQLLKALQAQANQVREHR